MCVDTLPITSIEATVLPLPTGSGSIPVHLFLGLPTLTLRSLDIVSMEALGLQDTFRWCPAPYGPATDTHSVQGSREDWTASSEVYYEL